MICVKLAWYYSKMYRRHIFPLENLPATQQNDHATVLCNHMYLFYIMFTSLLVKSIFFCISFYFY